MFKDYLINIYKINEGMVPFFNNMKFNLYFHLQSMFHTYDISITAIAIFVCVKRNKYHF